MMTKVESSNTGGSGGGVSPGRRRAVDWRAFAMPMLAFGITVLVFAPFAPHAIDPHDGLMLKPALDVLSGQALYRDTMSQHGPLNTYLQVGFLALLGPKLISLKIGTVVTYGLAAGLLAATWGRFLPPSLTALSLLLWGALAHFYDGSAMYPWPSVNCLVFQAAGLFFLLKSTPNAGVLSLAYPLLCGASAGLCYWSRFDVGLLLFAALGTSCAILACAAGERPWASRRLYAFIVGTVAVHFVFLAIIVLTGATTDWFYQNYTFFAKYYSADTLTTLWRILRCLLVPAAFRVPTRSDPVRALLPLVAILGSIATLALGFLGMLSAGATEADPGRREGPAPSRRFARPVVLVVLALSVFIGMLCRPIPDSPENRFAPREFWFFLIPYVVLAATAAVSAHWLLLRRRGVNAAVPEPLRSAFIAGLVALAAWVQYYPWGDYIHGWWALAPGIGVFAFFVLWLARGRTIIATLALGALVLPLILQRSAQAVTTLLKPCLTIRSPLVLSGMKLPRREGAVLSPFLAVLDGYLNEHPQTALLVDGSEAVIFASVPADLRNPSNIWWYDRIIPIPRPDEIEARRRKFIRDRRPLVVFGLLSDPDPPQPLAPKALKLYQHSIEVNRDREAHLEDILRDENYLELARVENKGLTLVLVGPRN
jgi:hypothetical protein